MSLDRVTEFGIKCSGDNGKRIRDVCHRQPELSRNTQRRTLFRSLNPLKIFRGESVLELLFKVGELCAVVALCNS
ncbi:MAG: hypothetical protein DMG63_00365 [Acidobacteria bacterium]|nr:MAG: hypothetical protein DMG63_00365 [Acidobacteriota bacterium]